MKEIKKGEAKFRETYSRSRTCETCDWFDPYGGKRNMGQCLMKVPEAEFDKYPPWKYVCKYWEEKRKK